LSASASRSVGMVRCMVTVNLVRDVAIPRDVVVLSYLTRLVEQYGANVGHLYWTLGPVQYRPTPVVDSGVSSLHLDFMVLHPLCRRVAVTDDEVAQLAGEVQAAPLEGGSWVFTAGAEVLVSAEHALLWP
jgi:hypothetical protein